MSVVVGTMYVFIDSETAKTKAPAKTEKRLDSPSRRKHFYEPVIQCI